MRAHSLCIAILSAVLLGCNSLARIDYTSVKAKQSKVIDLNSLHYYADDSGATLSRFRPPIAIKGEVVYLALSGGGADGAFGAGMLVGLSDAKRRPEFSTVSGVSTGALIAPFAFLGSEHDRTLTELYTSGIAASLVQGQGPLSLLSTSGPFTNKRLRQLVDRYVDEKLLQAIAAESARGRTLIIITTNLDTQRASMWDMGKVAEVGTPGRSTCSAAYSPRRPVSRLFSHPS